MPAAYAHIFFGNTVYHHLPQAQKESIGREKALFEIGLQGPDILFYYPLLHPNEVSAIGVQTRQQTGREWFSRALLELERQKGDYELTEGSKAYIAGVLCYFVLQSRCYDAVNQYAAERGITTAQMEDEFDRSIMKLKQKDPVSANPIPGFYPSHRAASIISLFYPGLGVERADAALKAFAFSHQMQRRTAEVKQTFQTAGGQLLAECDALLHKNDNPGHDGHDTTLSLRHLHPDKSGAAESPVTPADEARSSQAQESGKALLHILREAVPAAVELIDHLTEEEVQKEPIFACDFSGRQR